MPRNDSRQNLYLNTTEYVFEQQKYFHILTLHIIIGLFSAAIAAVAAETFALSSSLQAFAMFQITR